MFNKQYSLAQLKESSAERKLDVCNTTCNKLTNQVKETCVRATEPKTLVSHQLLSLVLQDTSLGGKTASMLKNTESNETAWMLTLISYSHKASRSMAHKSQIACSASSYLAPTAATLNTLMPEIGKKEER